MGVKPEQLQKEANLKSIISKFHLVWFGLIGVSFGWIGLNSTDFIWVRLAEFGFDSFTDLWIKNWLSSNKDKILQVTQRNQMI